MGHKQTQNGSDKTWHIRLTEGLISRIERLTKQESKRIGRPQKQTDMLRQALDLGLAQLERKQ